MENRLLDIDNKTKNTSAYRYRPVFRRLRGYAFDPSLSTRVEMADVNLAIFKIIWEDNLKRGPIGEYIEVIDIDPASQVFYEPVDLNDPYILALDGLPPSESNPQFHQQMVYAVAMTTIQHFEKALGRKVMWSSIDYQHADKNQKYKPERYVACLRIYPHAIREANAFYSPDKKAILFGYFVARPADETTIMPGTLVFTCLSHDIIAHEVTHAIIDGQHRQYIKAMTEDTLALHEAFSDIVALFQHFTFKEVLKNQIAKTRGELESQNLLGELAQQLGLAIGNYESLRSALGKKNKNGVWELTKPNPIFYKTLKEPHDRGAILVATIFRAFLKIYKKRSGDLFRIATNGTGVLPAGDIHPDLVNRLATEASLSAKHVLSMCIRSLDYCPPVRVTFGDMLRAIITADYELISDDDFDYRLAFIESFKEWGIYPKNIFSLSEESLIYRILNRQEIEENLNNDSFFQKIISCISEYSSQVSKEDRRNVIFDLTIKHKLEIHRAIRNLMIILNDQRVNIKGETDEQKALEDQYEIKYLELEKLRMIAQFEKNKRKAEIDIESRIAAYNKKLQKPDSAETEVFDKKAKYDEIDKEFRSEIEKISDQIRLLVKSSNRKRENDILKKIQVLKELSGFVVPFITEASLEKILFSEMKSTDGDIEKTEGFFEVSESFANINQDEVLSSLKMDSTKYKFKFFIKINKRIPGVNEKQFYPNFQVYNLNYALRVGPDNVTNKQVVLSILQDLYIYRCDKSDKSPLSFETIVNDSLIFRGGSTLIIDSDKPKLKYSIVKKVDDNDAIIDFLRLENSQDTDTTPFGIESSAEPFAILHRGH